MDERDYVREVAESAETEERKQLEREKKLRNGRNKGRKGLRMDEIHTWIQKHVRNYNGLNKVTSEDKLFTNFLSIH